MGAAGVGLASEEVGPQHCGESFQVDGVGVGVLSQGERARDRAASPQRRQAGLGQQPAGAGEAGHAPIERQIAPDRLQLVGAGPSVAAPRAPLARTPGRGPHTPQPGARLTPPCHVNLGLR